MKLFHLSLHLKLLWCSVEALYMVRYTFINHYFMKVTENAEYPPDDPLNLADLHARQIICDRVIAAREYEILGIRSKKIPPLVPSEEIPENINFQRFASTPTDPNPDFLKVSDKLILLQNYVQNDRKLVQALECVRTPEKNWFVVFGQKHDTMFLIEPLKSKPLLHSVKALIEEDAIYDTTYSGVGGQHHLQEYFIFQGALPQSERGNVKPGRTLSIPPEMELCSLSFIEYGRLCSAVSHALGQSNVGFVEEPQHVNYISIGNRSRRCLRRYVRVSEYLFIVLVLPCSINRLFKEPQFFLLADPVTADAVYVLTVKDMGLSKRTLEVKARVSRLKMLLERETASSSTSSFSHLQTL